MGDAEVVLMHPLMVLVRGIGGGAITSATGAKARIGGAHRVEYSNVMVIGSCAFRFCDFTHIYCEADSQPTGWDEGWNYDNIPVTWGYAGE